MCLPARGRRFASPTEGRIVLNVSGMCLPARGRRFAGDGIRGKHGDCKACEFPPAAALCHNLAV